MLAATVIRSWRWCGGDEFVECLSAGAAAGFAVFAVLLAFSSDAGSTILCSGALAGGHHRGAITTWVV